MAVTFQMSLEQIRETFPYLSLAFIGIGILALLWLVRKSRKNIKAKPRALKSLERTHAEAIREISFIKMNQIMDKRLHAIRIPRRRFPASQNHQQMLSEITKVQHRALSRRDKPQSRG